MLAKVCASCDFLIAPSEPRHEVTMRLGGGREKEFRLDLSRGPKETRCEVAHKYFVCMSCHPERS